VRVSRCLCLSVSVCVSGVVLFGLMCESVCAIVRAYVYVCLCLSVCLCVCVCECVQMFVFDCVFRCLCLD
jgi:hypothetical protein